jgi:hypothetical protein
MLIKMPICSYTENTFLCLGAIGGVGMICYVLSVFLLDGAVAREFKNQLRIRRG